MSQKIRFFKSLMYSSGLVLLMVLLSLFPITDVAAAPLMQQTTPPVPRVAIHISEYTKAITPSYDAYWHYFVMPESLKEALDAAGIPWTAISDADIASGALLYPNGSPRYPILFSLASEAIADNEVGPLRDYVDAGGFLFVGASAFTRRPDGSARSDFALAPEMGLQSMGAWYTTSNFTKVSDHRLVSHIPDGSLSWRMPLHAEQPPWGVSPSQSVHAAHYAWRVTAHTAEVIANGGSYPRLATKDYGDGRFIYYSQLNPLIGHGGYGPGMYAYLIFLNAIEEAFESFGFPVVKLSPWQYPYDAAFIVRHDFENTPSRINSIESSSQVEASYGALGDYYFCTGVIRLDSEDPQMTPAQKLAAQNSVRRAVVNYGATIGSHNGGLPNPTYNYDPAEYRYWHWGTDQALDADPASLPVSGFTSGYEYAYTSVLTSFLDISSWLTGTDNGRPGCGTTDTCPRTWVSPYFNSTREGSYQIMEELDVVTMGEQKISPFPHWTISYQTDGKRYPHISLPTSDWFVDSGIAQSMEGHTTATMQELVDFYYDIGALINLYSHQSSTGGVARDYLIYGTSKPRVWSTNAVGIYDWWQRRSPVSITPSYSNLGHNIIAKVQVSGAIDPETAVEFTIPHWESFTLDDVAVFLDGVPAGAGTYRSTSNGVKVQVGTWVYEVEIRYTSLDGWVQSDWSGGAGQDIWADETRYLSATDTDPTTVAGQLRLAIDSEGDPFFADDFVRAPGEPDPLLPWVAEMGTWSVENEVLEAATSTSYVYAYMEEPSWTDYSVMARIQFPSGAYGGGIGGRFDPATGAHYAAWFYPRDNRLRLVKFSTWTAWNSPNGLATVDIPAPGTDWHTLRMDFAGDHIQVYYDGEMVIDVQDSTGPFLSGGITVDAYQGGAYAIRADDVIVSTPLGYVDQGVLRSSAFDGGLGVQWQRLSWLSSTPADTGIRVRTRTADQAGQLDAASWSAWVNASGGPVPSSDKRWIQYEVELTSALTTTTPLFQEIGITYVPGPGDHIDVLEPHSGASETHISLSAALLEDDGTPITGRSLEFTLAGLPPVTGVTNGSGVAAASLDLLLAPGTYPLTVAFAGDTDFSPASTPATFTVTSPWSEWVQDTQADFTADTLTHTTALSVPGSVVLERILMGEGEEQGLFVVEGQQPRLDVWEQTDWSGGSGQMEWADATRYATASSIDDSVAGQLTLATEAGSAEIFSEDFSDPTEPLGAWTVAMGSWSVATETLRAISPSGYSYIHTTAGATWSDYTVTGQIQFPAGAFGGGIGGRLDPATGAHYAVWIYPGSNTLRLIKFYDWDSWNSPHGLASATIPNPGTGWHELALDFQGNRIRVYYDGVEEMDVTDDDTPHLNGSVSIDSWGSTGAYQIGADDIVVTSYTAYAPEGSLLSSAFDAGEGAQWETLEWEAVTDANTTVQIRTRTADQLGDLSTASWSGWNTTSGDPIANPDARWIQYEVQLATDFIGVTPILQSLSLNYALPHEDTWSYRHRLLIDNPLPDSLPAGHSVKLELNTAALVAAGKLRADGDDLRVVWQSSPGTWVELDRVAETAFNTTATEIWFKTQSAIPGNGRDGNYYLYYGNPLCGLPRSDPAQVWSLWDDFSGDSLSALWSPTGSIAVSDGLAHISPNANMIANTTSHTYALLEAQLRLSTDNGSGWWGWEDGVSDAPNFIVFQEYPAPTDLVARIRRNNGAVIDRSVADPAGGLTQWHTHAIDWIPGQAQWLMDGQLITSTTENVPASYMYPNFKTNNSLSMAVDWVRVRRRVAQEPVVSLATTYWAYTTEGRLLSVPYDTQQFSRWKYLTWDAHTPSGTGLQLQVRTAATQQDLISASWHDYAQSGELISNPLGRWVQYAATLNTSDILTTPALHKVTLYYLSQPATLSLAPAGATIAAGESVGYSAELAADGDTWNVTAETSFEIDPGAGGLWSNGGGYLNTYTGELMGTWTVSGTYANMNAAAGLTVQPAQPVSITLRPESHTLVAGEVVIYQVIAEDAYGNRWDASAGAVYSITTGAGGRWVGSTYISEVTGDWIVQATLSGQTAQAGLHVGHGDVESLQIAPDTGTLQAGERVTYTVTANDAYANTWDVTAGTTFTITDGAGGSWLDNAYTTGVAGSWIVTGNYAGQDVQATLDVVHAEVQTLTLTPEDEVLVAGESLTYTVTAVDAYQNRWDVTAGTIFSIPLAAGGSWSANTYTSEIAGSWPVLATFGVHTATTQIHVFASAITGITLAPAVTDTYAGQPVTYTVMALDTHGNTWDVSSQAHFANSLVVGGDWSDNVYTGEISGSWTVTATLGAYMDTAVLNIYHTVGVTVALVPAESTLVAGDTVTYTVLAQDIYGNAWDVTAAATFSHTQTAGGSWLANTYTAEKAGSWTIYATWDGLTTTALLHVFHTGAVAFDATPDIAELYAGQAITYTAMAEDTYGNTWDVTLETSFEVSDAAGGSWLGSIYTSEIEGRWPITATYGQFVEVVSLTVYHKPQAVSLILSPALAVAAAGESVTYTTTAQDIYGNTWDATEDTTFSIVEADAGGAWNGRVYIGVKSGTWTVQAQYAGLISTAELTIETGEVRYLYIDPVAEQRVAGESVTYTVTAEDDYGNTRDVTLGTVFSISAAAGGYWSGVSGNPNTYTGEFAGVWDITATYGGVTTTAQLTVTHAGALRLQIAPNPATVASGDPLTYTALAEDTYGNTWDVTPETVFSIAGSGHGGVWLGNVYTAGVVGTWQVQGKYQALTTLAMLHVVYGEPQRLSLSPAQKTLQTGDSVTYQAVAEDGAGNTWDVTAQVVFSILEPGAGGSWVDNTYTGAGSGSWTVAGTYTYAAGQTLTGTAQLTVLPGTPQALSLLPSAATIASGTAISYTAVAEDSYGNTWDVTADTAFDLPQSAGGNWRGNVYTGGLVGIWEVSGQYGKLWATADLTVTRGAATSLTLAPAEATVKAGEAVTYTATAADAAGNTWDATVETTFSIADPGAAGVWNANRYTSGQPGDWTVVGEYDAVTGAVLLHVEPVEQPQNPVPVALSLDPEAVDAQSGELTLTVRGRDFVAGAQVTWDGVAQTTEVLSTTEVQVLIAAELVLEPGAVNIRVINPGPGGGTSAPLTFTVRPVAGPVEYAIYLPQVQLGPEPIQEDLPDLVVKSITVQGWHVEVEIENQGTVAVPAGNVFWVDLYVDPVPPPARVNETWSDGRCSQGIVWGISGRALPLEPGATLKLTLGDRYYWDSLSNFNDNLPAGVPIYAQVDSANLETGYGSVLEGHEQDRGLYNNIFGPVLTESPNSSLRKPIPVSSHLNRSLMPLRP